MLEGRGTLSDVDVTVRDGLGVEKTARVLTFLVLDNSASEVYGDAAFRPQSVRIDLPPKWSQLPDASRDYHHRDVAYRSVPKKSSTDMAGVYAFLCYENGKEYLYVGGCMRIMGRREEHFGGRGQRDLAGKQTSSFFTVLWSMATTHPDYIFSKVQKNEQGLRTYVHYMEHLAISWFQLKIQFGQCANLVLVNKSSDAFSRWCFTPKSLVAGPTTWTSAVASLSQSLKCKTTSFFDSALRGATHCLLHLKCSECGEPGRKDARGRCWPLCCRCR